MLTNIFVYICSEPKPKTMRKLRNLLKSKKQIRIEAIQSEIKLFQAETLNSTFTAQYQENEINRLKSTLIKLN